MRLPETDDLVLFGSLALLSVGSAFVTASSTGNLWLAFGVGLVVLGFLSTFVAFLAAGEPE